MHGASESPIAPSNCLVVNPIIMPRMHQENHQGVASGLDKLKKNALEVEKTNPRHAQRCKVTSPTKKMTLVVSCIGTFVALKFELNPLG
jgi:hypothetical protein